MNNNFMLLKIRGPRFIWQKVVSVGVKRSGGSEMVLDSKRAKGVGQDVQGLSRQLIYFRGLLDFNDRQRIRGHEANSEGGACFDDRRYCHD